jgi:hypothetical protein
MDGVPKTLRHFLTTEHAAIHRGQAAIYGLITSEPHVAPISYAQFGERIPPAIGKALDAFAAEHGLAFSLKDAIGFDVHYTDMANFTANFFFLTSTEGRTVFINTDGAIELVEIPDPDAVSAPTHMWAKKA